MSDTLDPRDTSLIDTTDSVDTSVSPVLPKSRPRSATASQKKPATREKVAEASEKPDITLPPTNVATPLSNTPSPNKLLAKKGKPASAATTTSPKDEVQNIADWMDREYRGVSIYAVLMGMLLTLILWTGISTVRQIQAYHHQYTELQKTKKAYRQLQVEHQRLLIEQQTFSATPQIARRAVTELNMFYPKLSDRLIVQLPAPATVSATVTNNPAMSADAVTATTVAQ